MGTELRRKLGTSAKPLGDIRRGRRLWAFVAVAGPGFLQVLTEAGEIIDTRTSAQSEALVTKLARNHVLFAVEWRAVLKATDPTRWTFRQRRARIIDARHIDGARLVKLPADTLPHDPSAAMVAFARYMFWLGERDVWPTSRSGWSTLGRHLWLSTLTRPVRFYGGPRVERQGLFGGRKDAPFPARYRQVAHYDISAAYPSVLAGPMPQTLRLAPDTDVVWDPERDGIACARVWVPSELEYWPPLPMFSGPGNTNYLRWTTGELGGWWSFAELRSAVLAGCTVEILEAWAGVAVVEPFAGWYDQIREGRELTGGADRLVKSHANALWSSFAVAPATVFVRRFTDRLAQRSEVLERRPGVDFTKGSAYVSALCSARVRVRLYQEALAPDGRPNDRIIYVDTDGVMTTPGRAPKPLGVGLGLWRQDRTMRTVDIRCPGAYRYTCDHCGDDHPAWHYKVAGATSHEGAQRRFSNFPRQDSYDQNVEDAPI